MVMSMYISARNEAIENLPAKSKIMPIHSAIEFGPLSVAYLQRFVFLFFILFYTTFPRYNAMKSRKRAMPHLATRSF
jgi:hypothetical protein